MNYAFHPEAQLEYLAAARFYEQRQAGLGVFFSIEIEAAIERVGESPTRWPVIAGDIRRCLAHTFPYGILYSIEGESILILAVAHGSRKPGYWKDRLGS